MYVGCVSKQSPATPELPKLRNPLVNPSRLGQVVYRLDKQVCSTHKHSIPLATLSKTPFSHKLQSKKNND